MLDTTDKDVALAVVKRLGDMRLRSLRNQAAEAPVSRGTLGRWRNGDYDMHDDTRNACLAWLDTRMGILTTSYADGLGDAMRRYEESVNNALQKAREEIEALIDKSTSLEDEPSAAVVSDESEASTRGRRKGKTRVS